MDKNNFSLFNSDCHSHPLFNIKSLSHFCHRVSLEFQLKILICFAQMIIWGITYHFRGFTERPIIFNGNKTSIFSDVKSGFYFWCLCESSIKQPFTFRLILALMNERISYNEVLFSYKSRNMAQNDSWDKDNFELQIK